MLREPNRVVLDLARVDPTPELKELPAHVQATDPYIASIRIGTQSGGFLRLVLDLKEEVNPQVFALKPVAEFGYRLVVDLYPLTPVDPLMALLESEQRREAARAPVPETKPQDTRPPPPEVRLPVPESRAPVPESRPSPRIDMPPKSAIRKITVAIDPGHGGEARLRPAGQCH